MGFESSWDCRYIVQSSTQSIMQVLGKLIIQRFPLRRENKLSIWTKSKKRLRQCAQLSVSKSSWQPTSPSIWRVKLNNSTPPQHRIVMERGLNFKVVATHHQCQSKLTCLSVCLFRLGLGWEFTHSVCTSARQQTVTTRWPTSPSTTCWINKHASQFRLWPQIVHSCSYPFALQFQCDSISSPSLI